MPNKPRMVEMICGGCGEKVIRRYRSARKVASCSTACTKIIHAKFMEEYVKSHPQGGENNHNWKGGISLKKRYADDFQRRFPKKYRCHVAVARARRDGTLVRGNCEECGTNKRIEGHHPDYDKPLEVVWLCKDHHLEWHKHNTAINGD